MIASAQNVAVGPIGIFQRQVWGPGRPLCLKTATFGDSPLIDVDQINDRVHCRPCSPAVIRTSKRRFPLVIVDAVESKRWVWLYDTFNIWEPSGACIATESDIGGGIRAGSKARACHCCEHQQPHALNKETRNELKKRRDAS